MQIDNATPTSQLRNFTNKHKTIALYALLCIANLQSLLAIRPFVHWHDLRASLGNTGLNAATTAFSILRRQASSHFSCGSISLPIHHATNSPGPGLKTTGNQCGRLYARPIFAIGISGTAPSKA
jgi:hypothetical protein